MHLTDLPELLARQIHDARARWRSFRAEHARAQVAALAVPNRLLSLEVVTRVLADVVIVNTCYLAALVLRLLVEPDLLTRPGHHLGACSASTWPTSCC